MLDKLIIVDYVDGSGGEYFSNFISSHRDFYSQDAFIENMQQSTDIFQKFFNSTSLIKEDWNQNFIFYLKKFEQLCQDANIKNICVPYHLYKYPNHINDFKIIAEEVRFVKILTSNNDFVYDFIKKILLFNVTKANFNEVKFKIFNATQEQKMQILQRLKNNTLYWLDVNLILHNKKVNTVTRQTKISSILNAKYTLPSNDLEILYEDFFVNFNKINDNYILLCNQLNITPQNELLERLVNRNRQNYKNLVQYKENFNKVFESL